MIVNGYGISMERLKEKDLELVREKRNSQTVSQFMEYREHITPEMQKKWFDSINNYHNLYYVVSHKGKKVGLINGAKIDWTKMETASGGIFIWDKELWQTYIPLMANMVLMDIAFLLGLRRSFVKIMNDNKRAIQYNTMLGYEIWPHDGNEDSKIYVLDTDNYLRKTAGLRKYLDKTYGGVFELVIDDPETEITHFLLERIRMLAPEYKNRFKIVHIK